MLQKLIEKIYYTINILKAKDNRANNKLSGYKFECGKTIAVKRGSIDGILKINDDKYVIIVNGCNIDIKASKYEIIDFAMNSLNFEIDNLRSLSKHPKKDEFIKGIDDIANGSL